MVQAATFGVGHANYGVASEQVEPVVAALLKEGRAPRASAGLSFILVDRLAAERESAATGVSLLPPAAAGADAQPAGLLVTRVEAGRPAAAAGLREGDVLLTLQGAPATKRGAFLQALGPVYTPGARIRAEVWRPAGPGMGGRRIVVDIKPEERPERRRGWLRRRVM